MSKSEVKLINKTDKPFFSYNLAESSTKVNGKYYIVIDSDESLKEIYQALHYRISSRFKSRLQAQGLKPGAPGMKERFDQEYADYMRLRFAVPEDLDRYDVETTDVRSKVKTRKYTKSSDEDKPERLKKPIGRPRTRVISVNIKPKSVSSDRSESTDEEQDILE